MLELGHQKMVPLEAETLEDLLQIALYNIRHFDQAAFGKWLKRQPGDVQDVARRRPPAAVYRLVTDNEVESMGKEAPMILGVVVGYPPGTRGAPALCAVQILGVKAGVGSNATPVVVPTEVLEDVTEKARTGKIALP